MIELTQEQWQVISQEPTPTVMDPKTSTTYVVLRKQKYDELRAAAENEADVARALRLAWMRRMKLDEDEIAESLREDPPLSVQEEMQQIKALDHLDQITPPGEALRKLAIEY